jgi:hypothetical protein
VLAADTSSDRGLYNVGTMKKAMRGFELGMHGRKGYWTVMSSVHKYGG